MSSNDSYRKEDLVRDLNRLCSCDSVKQEIVKNFDMFVAGNKLNPPSELLSKSILTPQILEKLGVGSGQELEYIGGAFKIHSVVDLRTFSEQFIDQEGTTGSYVVLSGNSKRDYLSGINNNLVETPENWYNRKFPQNGVEYLYHRGHVIAKSFQQYTRSYKVVSLINKRPNIYVSTNWLNHANHSESYYGVNQTYVENWILKIMIENPNVRINYRAILVFHDDENIPRGIHLKVEFDGKIQGLKRKSEFNTLNLFIPNIDPRFIVDYKRRY